MTPRLTVAVVSWNTRELLARCLASLEPSARAGLASVWVVDNVSDDGSPAMVSERFPWVSLIASERNLGFGPAVNLVAQRSASPWIAPANADVAVAPGALEALLDVAEAHPEAAILAPRLVLPDGSTQHSVFSFPTLSFTALLNLGVLRRSRRLADRTCLEGAWDPERAREVPWAIGALLVVRRSAFDATGGFDARQWMYAEDLDLAWRLARAGWKTRYVPHAVVSHAASAAAVQAFGDARTARWLDASYAWMRRRRGTAVVRAFAALSIGGAAGRMAVARRPWRGFPGGARARRAYWRSWLSLHRAAIASSRRSRSASGPPETVATPTEGRQG